MAKKRPIKPATRGSFTKDDDRAKKARAANNQSAYRDELVQIIISKLNEVEKESGKEYKYLLVDRLVALGCGLEFKIGKKTFQYAPDKGAIKELFDRLIGKPTQAVHHGVDGGKGKVTLIFDAPGDATGDMEDDD